MQQYVDEVESALALLPKRTSTQNPEAYIGGGQSQLRFIGLRVPDLRHTYRKGFSFSQNPPEKVARIWDFIWWNSNCFEVMSLALTWFEDPKQRKHLKTYWPMIRKWSARIDNWAHSDMLSGIYARIHEDAPAEVYATLQKWNASKNPWLRRLSIVSLFYYSSQRKKVPPLNKVTALLKPQLTFDHYYVQKGVGWTLREAGNVYPDLVYVFIEKNIHAISTHAFSAATEKMATTQREHLKQLRKQFRGMKQAKPSQRCKILNYSPSLKSHFERLNREWLEKYFSVEAVDRKYFANPEKQILQKGGAIFFAELDGDIVGTCSLLQEGGALELAKMAVTETARGKGIGEILAREGIKRAKKMKVEKLMLVTNSRLIPAVRLYEKLGFRATFRGKHPKYQRGDLIMEKAL